MALRPQTRSSACVSRTRGASTALAVAAAIVACAAAAPVRSQSSDTIGFPPPLERHLNASVRLTAAERRALLSGTSVSKLLEADAGKEVAVFGAVWIDAPMGAYVDLVEDIESFERGGGFHVTKRISNPPRLADFDRLTLSDEDVADLRTCRVGDCEFKLSEDALDRMRRTIDWSKPTAKRDVEVLARQIALDYVTGYLEGGNDRLAVYRDAARPTFVAEEFRSMVDRMPALFGFLPELRAYLLGFPTFELPNARSFLYWQEAQFGLKPTVRINHLVVEERPDGIAVANKQLYASHYFWTALELRVLVPDPRRGRGFWFVNINRSRSDGLSGFVGRMIRGRVQSEAMKGLGSILEATKATLE